MKTLIIGLILFIIMCSYLQLLAGSFVIYGFCGPLLGIFFGLCGMATMVGNIYLIKVLLNDKKI